MRVKKHANGNQYVSTPQNRWVRNFALGSVPYIDINTTIGQDDHVAFLRNEVQNGMQRYPWIDSEDTYHESVAIVSDGHGFKERHKLLAALPRDVAVIGVNGALAKWDVAGRGPTYYVVNNPYDECMRYLPRRTKGLPKCIASARTNSSFLAGYRGTKFRYYPVNEQGYTTLGAGEVSWQVDDYRNPICAALGLAYRFGATRVLLLCCDDVFEAERPGAEQLPNGLWMYPPHRVAHGLIDGSLHWFRRLPHQEVSLGDCSDGPLYDNAEYIREDNVLSFFKVGA